MLRGIVLLSEGTHARFLGICPIMPPYKSCYKGCDHQHRQGTRSKYHVQRKLENMLCYNSNLGIAGLLWPKEKKYTFIVCPGRCFDPLYHGWTRCWVAKWFTTISCFAVVSSRFTLRHMWFSVLCGGPSQVAATNVVFCAWKCGDSVRGSAAKCWQPQPPWVRRVGHLGPGNTWDTTLTLITLHGKPGRLHWLSLSQGLGRARGNGLVAASGLREVLWRFCGQDAVESVC